jgi:hypothetical protein
MNDRYYTQAGERPDLAALEVNAPESYIGARLFPIVPVLDKTGTVYYRTVQADSTAATSRSVATAPTATQISNSSTTYTTVEWIQRAGITPEEAKQMGGIEVADKVGANWAKRQVMNALEADVASLLLAGTASNNFDAAKVLEDIQTAEDAIRLYPGKTALVGGTEVLKRIVQAILSDNHYGPMLSRVISGTSPEIAAQGLSFKAWMAGLALFFGVDEVLAGDSAVWSTSTYDGHFCLARLPDPDPLAYKYIPQLGRCFQFMPDGKNPWIIQSYGDRLNINNVYDAVCTFDNITFNSSAFYMIDGVP